MNLNINTITYSDNALLRLPEIVGKHGVLPVSRSTFLNGVRDGIYPKPRKLATRSVAWVYSELMESLAKLNGEVGA